ncbi:MAG: CsbD family protein [Bryobacteraceae bacterium]
MDWNRVEGEWEQIKGSAKERWAKFTEDDLKEIAGNRDKIVGKLQEKYGISKDEAYRRAEEWLKQHRPRQPQPTGPAGNK